MAFASSEFKFIPQINTNAEMEAFLSALEPAVSVRLNSDTTQISVYDLMRLAGHSSGHKAKLARYEASVHDNGVSLCTPSCTWTNHSVSFSDAGKLPVPMVSVDNARRLVCFLLKRSTRSQANINETLGRFGITDRMFESAFTASAEHDTIASIARAIPFPSVPQFRVGVYRLDLYIPDVKVAVECQEHRHMQYSRDDELVRRRFIIDQLGCRIVEYDPYAARFNVLDVIRQVVEVLVCPEFRKWNQQRVVGPWYNAKDEPSDNEEEQTAADQPEVV